LSKQIKDDKPASIIPIALAMQCLLLHQIFLWNDRTITYNTFKS
jgi:hypothetical protein